MPVKNILSIKVINDPSTVYIMNPIGDHHHEGDIGFDLYLVSDIVIPHKARNFHIHLGVCCKMETPRTGEEGYVEIGTIGYMLAPRSSMAKTGLRQANSIGMIDAGYRGEIVLPVDNLSDSNVFLKAGMRLCQLVPFNGLPIDHKFVDDLDSTDRGAGGFGSTGA